MAIALVQSATQVNVSASSATALTITINGTVAGNCLIGLASIWDNNTTWTLTNVTDGGNTFAVRQAQATRSTDESKAVVAVAVNIAGGNRTVSFNLAGTSGPNLRYYSLGCLEFSGVRVLTPENAFDINETIDTSGTDISAGPITTTEAADLIVGVASLDSGADTNANFASPTSWTNSYRQNNASGVIGFDAGYWLPGAIQTNYSPQWSHDNNPDDFGAGVVVALRQATNRLMSEFFEATGYDETGWLETVPGTCVVDEDLAITLNVFPGWGSQALHIALDGGGADCHTFNAFGDGPVRFFTADFLVDALGFDTDSQQASVLAVLNAAGTANCALVQLVRSGGANVIAFYVYHNGSANLIYSEAVALDALYRWELKWDSTADTWELWVNHVSRGSGSLTGAAATTQAGLMLLGDLLNSVRTADIVYDRIEIDAAARIAGPLLVVASSITSLEAFGTAKLNFTLLAAAIATAEAFGTPVVLAGVVLLPTGIATVEAFGNASLHFTLLPSGIITAEAFGNPSLSFTLVPVGILTAEAFGSASVLLVSDTVLLVVSIESGEAFGLAFIGFDFPADADFVVLLAPDLEMALAVPLGSALDAGDVELLVALAQEREMGLAVQHSALDTEEIEVAVAIAQDLEMQIDCPQWDFTFTVN